MLHPHHPILPAHQKKTYNCEIRFRLVPVLLLWLLLLVLPVNLFVLVLLVLGLCPCPLLA